MRYFEQLLARLFAAGERLENELSARWRQNANRRTLAILIAGGTLAIFAYVLLIQPPDNFPVDRLVTVSDGASVGEIAQTLQENGVIRSPLAFRALVKIMRHERDMHAGDYLFKEPQNIFSVARAIALGQYGLEPIRIRVPEGARVKEMAAIFGTHLERFDAERFLASAQEQEGYLFPDTYFFLPNATDELVLRTLRQNFDSHVASIEAEIASSTHSLSDTVIMASILEREAFNTKDRRMISGVLWNRLARGMPLQVDATFVYTLGKGTFQLTMADLTSDSPYNTYNRKGLPPTPIGSPSLDSLLAAATPTKSDYLYFLADHSGVTHYCKNYSCQLANKARYF